MRTMEEKSEKKKKRKIAGTIVLCFAVLFSLFISIQIVVRGYADIAGYSVFRVLTGSMEPTLSVNTLVVSHKTNIEKIKFMLRHHVSAREMLLEYLLSSKEREKPDA